MTAGRHEEHTRAEVRKEQAGRNQDSRERWQQYAQHRLRVMALLLPLASPGARLLLVGAGNCNDVDLRQLQQHFAEIHLADIDGEAMRWGLAQQGCAGHPAFVLHDRVELTGAGAWMVLGPRAAAPSAEELEPATRALRAHQWSFVTAPFDVVASIGVLSQLLEPAILALPSGDPVLLAWMGALRLQHLRLLLQATQAGGHAMLVTEIVSSASCPELPGTPATALPALLKRVIAAGNFFTGLNPALLRSLWTEAPELAPMTARLRVSPAWCWDFGPRVYACCAFAALKR